MRFYVGFVMLSLIFISASLWYLVLRGWLRGLALLELEPRRPVPWALLDLMLPIALIAALQKLSLELLQRQGWLPAEIGAETPLETQQRLMLILVPAFCTFAAWLLSVLLIRLRTGAALTDFGYAGKGFVADAGVGVVGFLLLAPPVYLLQLALVQWFPVQHPYIEALKQLPDPRLYAASGFAAVIVAPLAEEFFFRGLVQGWLEGLSRSKTPGAWLLGESDSSPQQRLEINPQPAGEEAPTEPAEATQPTSDTQPPRWPIVVSALIFALAHYSHGPAPVSLFFLALGLGYLYQRTHRLWSCLVVHFLLNAWSMILLGVELYATP